MTAASECLRGRPGRDSLALEDENVEQPIQELEKRIENLAEIPGGEDRAPEIERLRRQLQDLRGEIYSHLSAWQKTQVARHPKRPYTLDYIQMLFSNWVEIHGDRKFADDPAIVGGFATYQGLPGQDPPQLWNAQPRRVSQGTANHEARGEIRPSPVLFHRHSRGLPGTRGGGKGTS